MREAVLATLVLDWTDRQEKSQGEEASMEGACASPTLRVSQLREGINTRLLVRGRSCIDVLSLVCTLEAPGQEGKRILIVPLVML